MKVGVIGAGTMGSGIAQAFAQTEGYEVCLCDINEEGYFEGDIEQIAITCNVFKEYVESIRQRFSQLEPSGVGALDLKESFLFHK